ncbi:tetratricopeptide repeat protein [Streptomyces sp. NPDC096032]|uniref:tetratricopeptide repeat protein n=1 Tax=Streptomyces sp. NPDC096032 TaxID=3366070 RepID=UPI00380C9031
MKHKPLLAVLFGVATVATGMTAWAIQSQPEAASESKPPLSAHEEANRYLRTGMRQDEQHRFKAAAQSYLRVVQLEPRNKFAWYNLGVAAQEAGSTAGAGSAYEMALKIDPQFPPALFNAALLLEQSNPVRAVALLQRATSADPKAATAHLHLGIIWARRAEEAKAVDEFRRAVSLDSSLLSSVPEEFRDSVPDPTASAGSEKGD